MTALGLVFALLVVYQVKHFLADYVLQGRYMLGKFRPGWDFVGPLLAHVGVHALGTYVISLVTFRLWLGAPAPLDLFYWALALAVGDAAVHFVMDRIKASPRYLGRFKALSGREYVAVLPYLDRPWEAPGDFVAEARKMFRSNTFFWWSLGLDQKVHHLTHYALIYFILRALGVAS